MNPSFRSRLQVRTTRFRLNILTSVLGKNLFFAFVAVLFFQSQAWSAHEGPMERSMEGPSDQMSFKGGQVNPPMEGPSDQMSFKGGQVNPPKAELSCVHIPFVSQQFFKYHLIHKKWTLEMLPLVVSRFVKNLDPDKIYLLEDDIAFIENHVKDFVVLTLMEGPRDWFQNPDCQILEESFSLFSRRLDERFVVIEEYITSSEFGTLESMGKTQLVTLAKNREYPKSTEEANVFIKKFLQLDVLSYMARSGANLEDAKSQMFQFYKKQRESWAEKVKVGGHPDLWAHYLQSFTIGLDSRSHYETQESAEMALADREKSFAGIGARIQSTPDGLFTEVRELMEGGGAMVSGKVKAKDKIIEAERDDGTWVSFTGQSIEEVVEVLRGVEGTTINIKFARESESGMEEFVVPIVRRKVELVEGRASMTYIEREVNGEKKTIGLLNLLGFYEEKKIKEDLKKIFDEARDKNISGVILDLSINPGGQLESAVALVGAFIDRGVVTTAWSDGIRVTTPHHDMINGGYYGPLIVLTSRRSASGSELVSDALQDYQRAIIVGGDQTLGKGSIQTVMPFEDFTRALLGATVFTSGLFLGPDGQSVQQRGVVSDISFPSPFALVKLEREFENSIVPPKLEGLDPSIVSSPDDMTGAGTLWKKVDESIISHLREKSQERVRENEKFDDIRTMLEKMKEEQNGSLFELSNLVNQIKKMEGEATQFEITEEEQKKRYLETAKVQEAMNIMVDYIVLNAVSKADTGGATAH